MFLRYYSSRRYKGSRSVCFFTFSNWFSSKIYGNCLGESITNGSPHMMLSDDALLSFLDGSATLMLGLLLPLLEFFLLWLGIPSRVVGLSVVARGGLFCRGCFNTGERMSGSGSNCLFLFSKLQRKVPSSFGGLIRSIDFLECVES